MGKTIKDIRDFPKSLITNKKKLNLYKAFVLTDPDDKMEINKNIEILYTDYITAVGHFMDQYSLDELDEFQKATKSGNQKTVSFVTISLELDDLVKKDIVDEGDPFYQDGQLAITLSDKLFTVSVSDHYLTDFSFTVDPVTEKRDYRIKLEPVKKTKNPR